MAGLKSKNINEQKRAYIRVQMEFKRHEHIYQQKLDYIDFIMQQIEQEVNKSGKDNP